MSLLEPVPIPTSGESTVDAPRTPTAGFGVRSCGLLARSSPLTALSAMSRRICLPSNSIISAAAYADVAGGGGVGAQRRSRASTRPPAVTNDPSAPPRGARMGDPDASAERGPRPVITSPLRRARGVAAAGEHHRDRRVVSPLQPRRRSSPPGTSAGSNSSSRSVRNRGRIACGLGVAEANVELEHPGPVGGEHQARRTGRRGTGCPRRASSAQDRLVHGLADLRGALGVDARNRRVGAHAAGVGSLVVVEDPLVVLRGGQRQRRARPSHSASSDSSSPTRCSSIDHALGSERARSTSSSSSASRACASSCGDDHPLAGRQAVGLDHRGIAIDRLQPRLDGRSTTDVRRPWARRRPPSPPCRTPWSPRAAAAAPVGPKHADAGGAPARRPGPPPAAPPGRPSTRSTASDFAAHTSPSTSSAAMSRVRASSAIPALPGAQSTSGSWGERSSACTIACSRAPAPDDENPRH